MTTPERLVIVKYISRGSGLSKKLFGYRSWTTVIGGKSYLHKPIIGRFQGLPIKQIGRASLLVPQRLLGKVDATINEAGGVVRSVEPVIMNEEDAQKVARDEYRKFIDSVIVLLNYASEAQNKQLCVSSLDKSISLTKTFEAYLGELDNYSFHKRDTELIRRLKTLKSIAEQDFEAAKIQSGFFAVELRNRKNQILK